MEGTYKQVDLNSYTLCIELVFELKSIDDIYTLQMLLSAYKETSFFIYV